MDIRTDDGPLSAHAEHAVVITADAPVVITA
jgi:methionine aminopeptidase